MAQKAPSINLPKGGGAIRGIGEKFGANPALGTGSLTVPIYTSPGRSGFGPSFTLSYDSGAGNGPFGFGWSLALPSISRKTDKGLPRYEDGNESDVFILSGAEDLVPALALQNSVWIREAVPPRTVAGRTYSIQRYRPRTEGLFARIERWTDTADPAESFWRSISRENVTTWYGRTAASRIVDPTDATRIYAWLICESYDDKGNSIVYGYKGENSDGVDASQAHEGHRSNDTRKANRYLARVKYGNRAPYYPVLATDAPATPLPADWMFEVVFDYGDHSPDIPLPDEPDREWTCRADPFSSCRAGFDVRTYRLCRRVLMFHHFPDEQEVGADCLVRSTDFTYGTSIFSFLSSVTQTGYRRAGAGYLRRSLPPLEFEYTQPIIDEEVRDIDPASLANLPAGFEGAGSEPLDLDGEGISGVLIEQSGGWFYKPNVSPAPPPTGPSQPPGVRFGALEVIASRPSGPGFSEGARRLLDLAGDGQVDLVDFRGAAPGYYERTDDERWKPFAPFACAASVDVEDPNLRFVDLTGDGHADILIAADDVFVWYPSLGEAGFGPPRRVRAALDEERGPRLVFAGAADAIYLADMSGDGLSDLVRVRNGEVCYWPNLGYGRFGPKVTMDRSPWLDAPEFFDRRRVRLADIDGSGVTDIIYLGRDGVRIYFNRSGNGWSEPRWLETFPPVDQLSSVQVADLLGNGTACLVWSSPLPGAARRPMRYLDLMGGRKPHLLVRSVNNLGAETRVEYASSTKFALADKLEGRPWMTRLPFPVHVVERVHLYDHVSRNRFVTRYAYHHGHFDGVEREFRGFGMVEQWDTEEFAALTASGALPVGENIEESSHVPPVLTRSWFHTGVHLGRDRVSNYFAGLTDASDAGEYYREPGLDDAHARALLLDDTALPANLTIDEEREACRALRGTLLRQEIYALDGTDKEPDPYSVAEQNFAVRMLQPHGRNRHAVFFTHPSEAITYQYERNPADPRVSHTLTLHVDDYGNVLKSVSVGYGRRQPDPTLEPEDQDRQKKTWIVYAEHGYTSAIDSIHGDVHRTPLPFETRSYELTGYTPSGSGGRFSASDFVVPANGGLTHVFDAEIAYEAAPGSGRQRRLIEDSRTFYRPDDLGAAANDPLALLPLGDVQPRGVLGETYRLALTAGLLDKVYRRSHDATIEALLPSPADVLAGSGAGRGGYVDLDADGNWWAPSGRAFCSENPADSAAAELGIARAHFFLPRRFRDPLGSTVIVHYDPYDLQIARTVDALNNTVLATIDYRVLQSRSVTDPNGNRSEVAFDALGLVAAVATMGKPEPEAAGGDLLTGFSPDLDDGLIQTFLSDPVNAAPVLLGNATRRIVYDLHRYIETSGSPDPQPVFAATIARETHVSDLDPGHASAVQLSVAYSDGFGREIQTKIQAEAGEVETQDSDGNVIVVDTTPLPRWVATGWAVFNNKGQPVRKYEPFFSASQAFEFGKRSGVSSVNCYDPPGRIVAKLHPNNSYEKVVFDTWRQATYDVNDTVLVAKPADTAMEPDVSAHFARVLDEPGTFESWYAQRQNGARGPREQAAAAQAAMHANTPAIGHVDSLGRLFLKIAHNAFKYTDEDSTGPPTEQFYRTRIELDIEGRERSVTDARDRAVVRYDYDMLGNRIHQAMMEAGERWIVSDVVGKGIRAWDSRGHGFRTEYDELGRPLRHFVRGTFADRSDPRTLDRDVLFEKIEYGESQPDSVANNLRTRAWRAFDGAGILTTNAYDFKGNLLSNTREFVVDYTQLADWSEQVGTQGAFARHTTYDALNRPVAVTMPDGTVIRATYNAAGLLESLVASLKSEEENGVQVWTPFIGNIDYDAIGRRTAIEYGNGTTTTYAYDRETLRIARLRSRRSQAAFAGDCPETPAPGWPGCDVQDLSYTYDAIGNITNVQDEAQQTIYFRNQRVEPSASYTYDAIYRLIEARGREHLGQHQLGISYPPEPLTYSDLPRTGLLHPGDGNALGRYTQRFVYDEVGNLNEVVHRGGPPGHAGWTRAYTYDEPSLLEPERTSNRLTRTTVSPDAVQPYEETYGHDAHGNMSSMPHLQAMQWDFQNHLRMTRRQAVNASDADGVEHEGERTFYVYDAAGQRARKVTELSTGALKDERIYVGGFEIYRRFGANPIVRETLHIMDDKQRIALVETRTAGQDGSPARLVRYQCANHLGSASLELDEHGEVISYEEYYPYGGTAYQASIGPGAQIPKRYRYAGRERDEENGFSYHAARYYAPWLGRWTAADPAGIGDGVNVYAYGYCNPIGFFDPAGTENTPANSIDRTIMQMTDPQLHAHLKKLSPADRATFARSASGAFSSRAWAMLNKYGMPIGYNFDAEVIHGKAPPKFEPPKFKPLRVPNERLRESVPLFSFFFRVPGEYVRPYQAAPAGAPEGLDAIRRMNGQPGVGVANFSRDIAPGTAVENLAGMGVDALSAGGEVIVAVRLFRMATMAKPGAVARVAKSAGAAAAGDEALMVGEWVDVRRGYSEALEMQGHWAGKPATHGKGTITLTEFRVMGTDFDDALFDRFKNLTSLEEFKWDYSHSISGVSPGKTEGVAAALVKQAQRQLEIADELGVPLRWHVRADQEAAFKNALGELADRIEWVPYAVSGAKK